MNTIDLICLANSRKHSGRCIAGLRLDGNGWVRPVAPTRDGTLTASHIRLGTESEPKIFDVLRVPLTTARPSVHQPENWAIGSEPWTRTELPQETVRAKILDSIQTTPALFGDVKDRLECDFLRRRPAVASLALIAPRAISWEIRTTMKGNRQTRAKFLAGQVFYNLSITDHDWERRLNHLPPGLYNNADAGLCPHERLLLTVSIGEPFESQCYKLVAAVIVLPDDWHLPERHLL